MNGGTIGPVILMNAAWPETRHNQDTAQVSTKGAEHNINCFVNAALPYRPDTYTDL